MIRSTIMFTTALATSLIAANAQAQDATAVATATEAAQPAATGIEDIVVTARRTEESLQTTPIAVTAIGTEALAREGGECRRSAAGGPRPGGGSRFGGR